MRWLKVAKSLILLSQTKEAVSRKSQRVEAQTAAPLDAKIVSISVTSKVMLFLNKLFTIIEQAAAMSPG